MQNTQKRCSTRYPRVQNIETKDLMCHLLISEYLTLPPSDSNTGRFSKFYLYLLHGLKTPPNNLECMGFMCTFICVKGT